jgi:hypothetical protein
MRLRWAYPVIGLLIVFGVIELARSWPPPWLGLVY